MFRMLDTSIYLVLTTQNTDNILKINMQYRNRQLIAHNYSIVYEFLKLLRYTEEFQNKKNTSKYEEKLQGMLTTILLKYTSIYIS